MGCLNDNLARLTQGVVIVETTHILPTDLKAHHQIVASATGGSPKWALCIQLLHNLKQSP